MNLSIPSEHIFDLACKYLARDKFAGQHSYFGHLDGVASAHYLEGWRFPHVEPHKKPDAPQMDPSLNEVTFIFKAENVANFSGNIRLIGDFVSDTTGYVLNRVEQSRYWSVSLLLPAGRAYNYAFIIDGQTVLDPINPRRRQDGALNEWSFFWTDYCRERVTFENWEADILQRITRHILPFQSREAQNFLQNLNPARAGQSQGKTYRLDLEMGVVNFIDKLIAGPELRQKTPYKACLKNIDAALRLRNPYIEPKAMTRAMYEQLYTDMANNAPINGWDQSTYNNPAYFLQILRRHTYIGAFSHPKYGGNGGAFAWDYLDAKFPNFAWRQALEKPLGLNTEYLG